MKIKFTENGYSKKPDSYEFSRITNQLKTKESKEISFRELGLLIRKGNNFILAEFEKDDSISRDNIKSIPAIALDIDSKINKIKMHKLIKILYDAFQIHPTLMYHTFSDTDGTRFRLIYKFSNPVNIELYEKIYSALINVFSMHLDPATKNPNRIWCGCNTKVFYNSDEETNIIKPENIAKIIQHVPKENIKRNSNNDKKYNPKVIKDANQNPDTSYLSNLFIKSEYKKQITDMINSEIDIVDFLVEHFNFKYKDHREYLQGTCCIHNGDNKTALTVYLKTNTYHCFTHCGTGNVLSLAKIYYNSNDFSEIALNLIDKYGLEFSPDAIGIKKN